MEATLPKDVAKKLGLNADTLLADMPPLSELSEGLEALLS